MKLKYISHNADRFRLITISTHSEEDAWEMIEDLASPGESGFLIPIRVWKRLLAKDSREQKRKER